MTGSHSRLDGTALIFPAVILGVPVLANNIAGAGEPFLIAPDLLQGLGCVMLDAIAGGVAERLEQPRPGQHGNVVGFEAQKPGGFKHVEPCGQNLPAQEFNLPFMKIHAAILQGGNTVGCI